VDGSGKGGYVDGSAGGPNIIASAPKGQDARNTDSIELFNGFFRDDSPV
jgi:hypothetical protein